MPRFRFESTKTGQEIDDSEFEKLYKELQENSRHQRENERQVIFEMTNNLNAKLDIECSRIEKQLKYHLAKIEKVESALKMLRHHIVAMQQELVKKQTRLKAVSAQKKKMEEDHDVQIKELKKQKFDLDFQAADIFHPDRAQFQFQAKRLAKQIDKKIESFEIVYGPIKEEFDQLTNDINELPPIIEDAIAKSKEMQEHIKESKQTIVRQREMLLSTQHLKEELNKQNNQNQ